MKLKNEKYLEKGITLISLSVTIVVLLIIAGIAFNTGSDSIKKAQLQELETNMLLIKAKARGYVEEATFKMGINPDEAKKEEVRNQVYGKGSDEGAQLEKVTSVPTELGIADIATCYWLTTEAKEKWGLEKMKSEENEYLIKFDEVDVTVEVYNLNGYNGKYSLTEIEQIQN